MELQYFLDSIILTLKENNYGFIWGTKSYYQDGGGGGWLLQKYSPLKKKIGF